MANTAIIITFGRGIPGREEAGIGIFGKSVETYGRLQAEGKIESFQVFLARHENYSPQRGCMVVNGTLEQLHAVITSAELRQILDMAGMVADDLRVAIYDTGEAIPERVAALDAARQELGF